MSPDWPTANLDPVRRLHSLAAGVRGAHVSERVIDAPFAQVWTALSDFEGDFRQVQPDMKTVHVTNCDGSRISLHARSTYGMRANFVGTVRPGWCWLQSRFLIVAMAATEVGPGQTRVAFTGGVRVPGRPALLPVGVRREARRSLDKLEQLMASRR